MKSIPILRQIRPRSPCRLPQHRRDLRVASLASKKAKIASHLATSHGEIDGMQESSVPYFSQWETPGMTLPVLAEGAQAVYAGSAHS